MEWQELNAEQRRYFVDVTETYRRYRAVVSELDKYQGGLYWKKANGREYLFRARNRRGYGRSLGPRSAETEATYQAFHERKRKLETDCERLQAELSRLSGFAVAAGIGRLPRLQADILRVLERKGWLGSGLRVGGSNAFYAYEAAAGIHLPGGLLETADLDLIFDHRAKLRLVGRPPDTLLAALQSVDKSFELMGEGHFAASNSRGFQVELIKPFPAPPQHDDPRRIGPGRPDLQAAEIEALALLESAPSLEQIVIADNGYPVGLVAPDPRYFAAHKLQVAEDPGRDPVKARRDAAQAEVLVKLIARYLPAMSLEGEDLAALPEALRKSMLAMANRFQSNAIPPGF